MRCCLAPLGLRELNWSRRCFRKYFKMPPIKLIFALVAALLLGPGLLAFGLWRLHFEFKRRSWIKLPAIITQSRIEHQYAGRGVHQSVPVIEFEFTHGDSLIRAK